MIALLTAMAMRMLCVEGNRLTYDGQPVTLRGVCVGDVLLSRPPSRISDYATIAKDWRANCVRIGVAPLSWRREPKEAMTALRREVKAAERAGMFVIVDWHAIGWPDGYTQLDEGTKDLYDSDFALATSFWKECAKAYKHDGRVAFQLWCEPVFQEQEWRVQKGSVWKTLKPYFERLTGTIRSEGAPNLLLATGNQWAYDLVGIREDPLSDPNTGYEWHVYGGHDGNDPAKWAVALDGLDRVKPVVVTEWGFQEVTDEHFKGTAETFGRPFLDFIELRGMSWTAWCWHPTWTPNLLEDDWKTPTPYGAFVRAALTAKAVDPQERRP